MLSLIPLENKVCMVVINHGLIVPEDFVHSRLVKSISKRSFLKLAQYKFFDGWVVLEWECCLKHPEDGAKEGAGFIKDHMIRMTEKAFDDFAGSEGDIDSNKEILGLSRE